MGEKIDYQEFKRTLSFLLDPKSKSVEFYDKNDVQDFVIKIKDSYEEITNKKLTLGNNGTSLTKEG